MKTSSAKAKGRRACQEVRDLILAYVRSPVTQRPLLPDDVFVTPSGVTGEDLRLSPVTRVLFNFAVEVKNRESINIWEAIEQAKSHLMPEKMDRDWLLIFRRNKSRLHVVLDFEVFLRLLYGPKL